MITKTISFCPALIIEERERPKEISKTAWNFGAWADQYLSFNDKALHVNKGRINAVAVKGYAWKTALKIISFVVTLLILPSIALIAKFYYKRYCLKKIPFVENAKNLEPPAYANPSIQDNPPPHKNKAYYYTMPELLEKAENFIKKDKIQNKIREPIKLPDLKGRIAFSEQELIDHWFQHYEGFCIGELHTSRGAKEFLVNHMAYLKLKGVKTLFMEHFCHETQNDLDSYIAGAPMSEALQNRVDAIDLKNHFAAPYGYRGVLEAAKKEGIRILAIDTEAAAYPKFNDQGKRVLTMNYFAYKLMKPLIHEGKFVALMGCGHLNKRGVIPGITTLLDLPNMIIDDKQKNDLFSIQLNAKPYRTNIQTDLYYLR